MKIKQVFFYTFAFSLLAILHAIAGANIHAQGGLVFADIIVGGQWTDQMQLFRRGLGKKMHKLVWYYGKWAKVTGMIDVQKFKQAGTYSGALTLRPSGKLIDVVRDFMREGGLYMDVPISVPLTGQGRHGSANLEGHEEMRKVLTKKVAINQLRHAVQIQDNKMSGQTLQKPAIQMALMERGGEDLRDWFSRKLAFYPYFALFTGYSDNLTDATYGVNMSQKSHPNFYVKGWGARVAFSNTFDAAYETAVATALASLSDDPGDYFAAKSIRDMVYLASYHKILPMTINGQEVYVIFIHPAQMRQLRRDSEWLEAQKFAGVRGQENQIFTGISEGYIYEGAYIIVDNTIPGVRIAGDTGYDATRGTVNYGSSLYMANPRDVSNRKLAVLCGAGAITAGYGSELAFNSRTADYGQFMGDGAGMILGMERADIIDDDNYFGNGAGAFYENSSSLVYGTWSPDGLTDI